jgi:membrane-bound ClpP family serine protease
MPTETSSGRFGKTVPVVVYVTSEGAQAASAGTFVGAAADVLVMAPTTNIGAASVVNSEAVICQTRLIRKHRKTLQYSLAALDNWSF